MNSHSRPPPRKRARTRRWQICRPSEEPKAKTVSTKQTSLLDLPNDVLINILDILSNDDVSHNQTLHSLLYTNQQLRKLMLTHVHTLRIPEFELSIPNASSNVCQQLFQILKPNLNRLNIDMKHGNYSMDTYLALLQVLERNKTYQFETNINLCFHNQENNEDILTKQKNVVRIFKQHMVVQHYDPLFLKLFQKHGQRFTHLVCHNVRHFNDEDDWNQFHFNYIASCFPNVKSICITDDKATFPLDNSLDTFIIQVFTSHSHSFEQHLNDSQVMFLRARFLIHLLKKNCLAISITTDPNELQIPMTCDHENDENDLVDISDVYDYFNTCLQHTYSFGSNCMFATTSPQPSLNGFTYTDNVAPIIRIIGVRQRMNPNKIIETIIPTFVHDESPFKSNNNPKLFSIIHTKYFSISVNHTFMDDTITQQPTLLRANFSLPLSIWPFYNLHIPIQVAELRSFTYHRKNQIRLKQSFHLHHSFSILNLIDDSITSLNHINFQSISNAPVQTLNLTASAFTSLWKLITQHRAHLLLLSLPSVHTIHVTLPLPHGHTSHPDIIDLVHALTNFIQLLTRKKKKKSFLCPKLRVVAWHCRTGHIKSQVKHVSMFLKSLNEAQHAVTHLTRIRPMLELNDVIDCIQQWRCFSFGSVCPRNC